MSVHRCVLILLLSAGLVDGAEVAGGTTTSDQAAKVCLAGEQTTVHHVVIAFECGLSSPVQVRVFDHKGRFWRQFSAKALETINLRRLGFEHDFVPESKLMATSAGTSCTAGRVLPIGSDCAAHYIFQCAPHRYRLTIIPDPAGADYVIRRSVLAKNGADCAQTMLGLPTENSFADDERVAITINATLPLPALPDLNLAGAPRHTVYDQDALKKLIAKRTRGRAITSPNAAWFAGKQKVELKSVSVIVERQQ